MLSPAILLSSQQWAQATFGSVQLGDPRRVKRAVDLAFHLAQNPQASLPGVLNPAALQASYRFVHSSHTSYERLVAPHWEHTRQACHQHRQVLLIQDTTEMDYQAHPTTRGLGPIGNGTHHGFLLQSVLAVVPQHDQLLGLAHQEPFLRQPAPEKESKQQRWKRERESEVWERSVLTLGSPPVGCQWIHVGDRYSDIFSFMRQCREQGCDFLVRAYEDRCIDLLVEQGEAPVPPRSHHHRSPTLHLLEMVKQMPIRSSMWMELKCSQKHPTRKVLLAVSWQCVRLLPPRTREANQWRPLVIWVIRAWEPDPPERVEALDWILLSSIPTTTATQAQERVAWYRRRWIVEDYHQGLKTGCHMEEREIRDYEGLRTLLGIIAPIAVRLLQLRVLSRQCPDELARVVIPTDIVLVVAHLSGHPAQTMTVRQCWHGIARQGGYLGRKGDGPPGWKTLWLGWMYIQNVLQGVQLASLLSNQLDL
ncbi:IS4 family transposase [Dictyobacter alpinus]|uniref:IS4 family transposase n=1 Tax=Dictyobacter alpinus TaxID=2014873 RepID=A0A402BG68_9CHLR|nr:IS4 family transposase [Dictyobacter alpinus]GCE30384.1 IS4 family transposase [Dictyobacter alpinus]